MNIRSFITRFTALVKGRTRLLISAIILLFIVSLAIVYFEPARASSNESSFTATLYSLTANGASATILTFRVFNGSTGVSGQTVDFTATGELNTFSGQSGQQGTDGPSISVVTDTNGNAVAVLRSISAGVKIVTASVAGDSSLTKTLNIAFTQMPGRSNIPLHISNPLPPTTPPTESLK